jgi:hypothetical protein
LVNENTSSAINADAHIHLNILGSLKDKATADEANFLTTLTKEEENLSSQATEPNGQARSNSTHDNSFSSPLMRLSKLNSGLIFELDPSVGSRSPNSNNK